MLDPKMIVLHYTAGDSVRGAYEIFKADFVGKDRPGILAEGRLNVAAHYIVDKKGRVCRLLDDTVIGRHVTGLNAVSIGIENVARGPNDLTAAQVDADVALIRRLKARFPGISHLIGHGESRRFKDRPDLWYERKPIESDHTDPGPAFMKRVRARVADLGLAGPERYAAAP